jgi:peptidoglycan lytic transglycosylase G
MGRATREPGTSVRSVRSARSVRAVVLGALVVVLGVVGAAVFFYQTQVGGSGDGAAVKVLIKPRSTGKQIAQTLRRDGVVGSDLAFRIFLKLKGAGGELQAGEYELRKHMAFDDLVATLERGPEIPFVKLTLPEGLTVEQTGARVGEVTKVSSQDFLAAATPATVKPAILPDGVPTLEGFLYPETYYIIEKEAAPDLVWRLVEEFGKRTADLPWDKAQALGRTPYEILVIASMVEREAQDPQEATLVSAVIHNRLRTNMPLGIDATIRYGINKPTGPLLQSELDRDTPYNTRLHTGIPPTPIANPGATAIRAALEPADSRALYFVRLADCRHHFFTDDYTEFQARKDLQPASC